MEESGSLYGSIQPYSPSASSSNSRSSIRRSWQRWRASRTRNGREGDSTGMRSPTINVANKSESSESSDFFPRKRARQVQSVFQVVPNSLAVVRCAPSASQRAELLY